MARSPQREPWRLLPPLTAAVPILIFSVAALAIPLAASRELGMSEADLSAWFLGLYAIPGLISIVLTFHYRVPLFMAWHTALVVFFATLADQYTLGEIRGAILVSGLSVVLLGITGVTARLASLVPTPVVFAVVAGSVLPFVTRTFTALDNEPLMAGTVLLAWLTSRKHLGGRCPPILPALIAGISVAAISGRVTQLPSDWNLPTLQPAALDFSLAATITILPVFVALTALHSNLTAVTYLRSQGYRPPARAIEVASGLGSMLGALIGPATVCMGALVTPLTAGPEAGERSARPWSVYAASGGFLLLGIGGAVASGLLQALPIDVLLAVAGLALVAVLTQAMAAITQGPMQIGPILAFAVSVSDLSMLGLGAPFWALLIGTGTALLLEREPTRARTGSSAVQTLDDAPAASIAH